MIDSAKNTTRAKRGDFEIANETWLNEINQSVKYEKKMKSLLTIKIAAFCMWLAVCGQPLHAQSINWNWRGPTADGKASNGEKPVVSWSESKNVLWKTKIPGRGHSSPIIFNNKIFLTTADQANKTQWVLCYDRKTGDQNWATQIHKGNFNPKIHPKNTHASPSIATDGQYVFAVFNNSGSVIISALDMDGNKLWKQNLGTYKSTYPFGFAASPILMGDEVLATMEGTAVAAIIGYDKKTGKETRRISRDKFSSYSTPVLAKINNNPMLLISGGKKICGYNPKSGAQLWKVDAKWIVTCGTMIWDNDIVFASGGYPAAQTLAIDGKSGRVLWENKVKVYEQSMLAHNGYVYALSDNGIAYCWDAKTGDQKWKSRLQGPVSASPVLANGNIYFTSESGSTFVVKATPNEFQLVSQNKLGQSAFASPAFVEDKIYTRVGFGVRGQMTEYLYCIGK